MAIQVLSKKTLDYVAKELATGRRPDLLVEELRSRGIDDPSRYIEIASAKGTEDLDTRRVRMDLSGIESRGFARWNRGNGLLGSLVGAIRELTDSVRELKEGKEQT